MREDNYNDNELIYLIRKGDKEAEKLLIEKYLYYIPAWLNNLLIDKKQLKNNLNEYINISLDVIYKCIECFRDEKGVFYSFASRAVINRMKNVLLKENKDNITQQYLVDKNYEDKQFYYDFPWEEKPYYEEEFYLKEKLMEINNFSELSNNEKQVISLYLQGNSLSKISEMLKINIKSVYNYYYRAKTKLKR